MKTSKNNFKTLIVIIVILLVGIIALWMVPNAVISLDGMLAQGQQYQKIGKSALALEIYKRAVNNYPDSYEAHLLLGNAYLEVEEPALAKEEFNKAVELSGDSSKAGDAQIAMSSMLLSDKNFEQAEKILLSVEDPKPKKVKAKLAEMYLKWGDDKFGDNTRLDAIDKYKLAFKNYDNVDVEAQQKVEDKVIKVYNDISNDFLTQKKVDQAISILKQSIEFVENSSAHIRLAEIYNKQNKRDDAISEYEKAYDVDTTGTSALYLSELLVEKGIDLARKSKLDEAKKCFEKAQEVNPSIIIPAEILYSVALSSIKTNLSPNTKTNKLYPTVSFVLTNQGNEPVDYLKTKVVFFEDGKIIGVVEKPIASKQKQLAVKESSSLINLDSPSGVDNIKKNHIIMAKIYLLYDKQNDWKFARTLSLSNAKAAFAAVKKPESKPSKPDKPQLSTSKPSNSTDKPGFTVAVPEKTEPPEVSPAPVNVSVPQPMPVPIPVLVTPGNSNSNGAALPPIE